MKINTFIDHTNLSPDLTLERVEKMCEECIEYEFAALCIPPFFLKAARKKLEDSDVKLCTVIGFPYGFSGLNAKVEDVKRAIDQGADEVDIVINHSAVFDDDWKYIKDELNTLATATHLKDSVLKIILEVGIHTKENLRRLIDLCLECQVDYIKTSSGKVTEPVDLDTIKWLKDVIGTDSKLKAAGGIRTRNKAVSFIEAGADRLGTSSGIKIVTA